MGVMTTIFIEAYGAPNLEVARTSEFTVDAGAQRTPLRVHCWLYGSMITTALSIKIQLEIPRLSFHVELSISRGECKYGEIYEGRAYLVYI